jgi:parallel beta-helix repeat protein
MTMKRTNLWIVIILTGLIVGMLGIQLATAKGYVGVLICGDTPALEGAGADSATWNEGIDKQWGYDEFWNDTFLIWELLYQHGFADEDIHVLFGKDGEDWPREWERYQAPLEIGSITDDSAYYAQVTGTFTALAQGDSAQSIEAMTEDDFLFCWTFDHGGGGHGPMSAYLYLMDGGIWDTTFARYVDQISCERRAFWMQQCHSGGFRDDLENDKTVFLSACDWDELAYRADDMTVVGDSTVENEPWGGENYHHGEFNFHTMNAGRKATPWGETIDPDLDGDGFVSLEEVWQWEYDHDSRYHFWHVSTPQYSDLGNIASGTFLNATPIVSGHIAQNTIWESDREVFVRGDVTVDPGVILTIEQGATVNFLADFDAQAGGVDTSRSELLIQGTLIAQGSPSEPIVFTSNADDPQPGDWYGIRFLDSSVDSACVVQNCHLSYAQMGIYCEQASPAISQNQIDNSDFAIYCYVASPIINNNEITGCTYGIYCVDGSSPQISDNDLQEISSCGIYCYSGCAPQMVSDTLMGKGYPESRGIVCWNSSPQIQGGLLENFECGINCCGGDPVISGLEVANNSQYGIACNVPNFPPHYGDCEASSPTITDNQISGSECGLFIGPLAEAYVASDTIYKNQVGIRSLNSTSVVYGNTIVLNNSVGVYCSGAELPNLGDLGNADITDDGYNEICCNQSYEVLNEASVTVKAENNWWGQYLPDPSEFQGLVDYDPAREQSFDTTAPAAIADLSATLQKTPSDSGLVLRWSEITTDADGKQEFVFHYVIYRSTEPLFEPSGADSVGMVPGDLYEYYDSDGVGQTGVNHFYVVKAVDCGSNKSDASNRVGEFDRPLANVK